MLPFGGVFQQAQKCQHDLFQELPTETTDQQLVDASEMQVLELWVFSIGIVGALALVVGCNLEDSQTFRLNTFMEFGHSSTVWRDASHLMLV